MPRIQVVNNRESVIRVQVDRNTLVELVPGLNLVEEKLWERCEANPMVAKFFVLRIERSPAPEAPLEKVGQPILIKGKPVADDAPLKKLDDHACQAMITETLDTRLLNTWLREEARPSVRRMLEAKLDEVDGPMQAARGGSRAVATPPSST